MIGETAIESFVFVGETAAFVLACWITHRAIRGYRTANRPALLWLALGIVLLSAVPTIARFLLPTVGVASVVTTLIARSCELAGLLSILHAIYGNV